MGWGGVGWAGEAGLGSTISDREENKYKTSGPETARLTLSRFLQERAERKGVRAFDWRGRLERPNGICR